MNNHWILVALHELEGIGAKTIGRLVQCCPDLTELLGASRDMLHAFGLTPRRADLILSELTEDYVSRIMQKYEESAIVPVTRGQEPYPPLLEETADPPWVLYARGRLQLMERPAIAVVGTRLPTVYGRRMAEIIARDLSLAGVCVASGMARGIDGAAHQGALDGPGGTIAVLGCGVDIPYPREHAPLYGEIARKGLILSEYPPGTAAAPGLFPRRNRILAGMSLGTFVVEASSRSGSLITADLALGESRDVYALPGPVTSPRSLGTNRLIQQGAKLVTGAGDILSEYEQYLGVKGNISPSHANTIFDTGSMTEDEKRVMDLLREGPATIDEIIERLQTNFGHLHAILLSLSLKKRIEQLPGSIYVLLS